MLLIPYEPEKFPRDLVQGQKIAVSLQSPAEDHWNIVSDRSLLWMLEESQKQREAQQAALAQGTEVEKATASPTEVHIPGEPPKFEAQGTGGGLPTRMAPDREWVLEATCTILGWFHTIHLQTMHEMGGVQELDRSDSNPVG